jgi:hypothetical protein
MATDRGTPDSTPADATRRPWYTASYARMSSYVTSSSFSKKVIALLFGAAGALLGFIGSETVKSWWDRPIPTIELASPIFEGYESPRTKIRPSMEFRQQVTIPFVSTTKVHSLVSGDMITLEDLDNIMAGINDDQAVFQRYKNVLANARKIVSDELSADNRKIVSNELPADNREKFLRKFLDIWAGSKFNILDSIALQLFLTHRSDVQPSGESYNQFMKNEHKLQSVPVGSSLGYKLSPASPEDIQVQMYLAATTAGSHNAQSGAMAPPLSLSLPKQEVIDSINILRCMWTFCSKEQISMFLANVDRELDRAVKEGSDLLVQLQSIKNNQNPLRLHVVLVASNLGKATIILRSDPQLILFSHDAQSEPIAMKLLTRLRLRPTRCKQNGSGRA